MISISHNITNPNRADQDPDQITHLWANGMAGDSLPTLGSQPASGPGAFSRNNPPPPRRNWGQVVGYETTMEPERYPSPLADGFRADWHDLSANVGNNLAEKARRFGYDAAAERLEDDAIRDHAAIDPLRDQYKYDPNTALAFNTGYYARDVATNANKLRNFWKLYKWTQKK